MRASRIFLLIGLVFAALPACSGGDAATSGDGGTGGGAAGAGGGTGGAGAAGGGGGTAGTGGTGTGGVMALCKDPTPVACEDQVILGMNLQPDPTKALISNEADGAGWTSHIDATAGGAFAATPDSYTYGKFSAAGLTKVDISDEASLASMDWDIAFRRYVVRINSGDSGPSCVQAARVPGMGKYEDLTSVPDTLSYHQDDYFTESCELIPDGSGLENSPATALSAYWTYPGCVKMSGYVFVVQIADGRHVKFIVDDYYKPAAQEQCSNTGMVPMSGAEAANFIVRWSYLD
jgi:hypothetical protein